MKTEGKHIFGAGVIATSVGLLAIGLPFAILVALYGIAAIVVSAVMWVTDD